MYRIPLIIILASFGSNLLAFDYFGNPIDYWKEGSASENRSEKQTTTSKKFKIDKQKRFKWKKYLDPNHDEFFEEGDYKPPKPFMEVARNPTDENIKNWFSVIEAKNKIMMRLQENLTRYLAENQLKLKNEEKQVIQNEINKMPKLAEDPYRYRFRLYFDSHCPHCKNMMQTMQDFQSMGYFVEIKQVDNKRPKFAVPFPITQATTEELKSRKIQASPTLFIADSKTKQIYRVEGYQTSTKILKNLSTK